MIKYMTTLLVVEDIQRSRNFYEGLLGMKLQHDLGVNVSFEGGLAIHLKDHFQGLMGGPERFPIVFGAHYGELYFETDEIEAFFQRLKQEDVAFVHEIVEQPWGQRVVRFYDPDRHVIEIGEQMEAVFVRMHSQGFTAQQIQQKTGMPLAFIEAVLIN